MCPADSPPKTQVLRQKTWAAEGSRSGGATQGVSLPGQRRPRAPAAAAPPTRHPPSDERPASPGAPRRSSDAASLPHTGNAGNPAHRESRTRRAHGGSPAQDPPVPPPPRARCPAPPAHLEARRAPRVPGAEQEEEDAQQAAEGQEQQQGGQAAGHGGAGQVSARRRLLPLLPRLSRLSHRPGAPGGTRGLWRRAGWPRAADPAAAPDSDSDLPAPSAPRPDRATSPGQRAFCPGSAPARPLGHRSGSTISFVSGASPLLGGLSPVPFLLPGHSLCAWDRPHPPLRARSLTPGSTPSCPRPGAGP